MRQNGSAAWVAILVLALCGIAAWFVFQPETEPRFGLLDASMNEEKAAAVAQPNADAEVENSPIAEEIEQQPSEQREEVRLAPEGAALVRVLDPAGDPVEHVAVAIGMQIPGRQSAIRLGNAWSDAEGYAVVVLDHVYRKRVAAFPPNPELMIDASFASLDRVRVRRLLDDAKSSETILRLPEIRLVKVRATLADGGPVDFPVELAARWAPAGATSDSEQWRPRRSEGLRVEGDHAYLVAAFDLDLQLSCWDARGLYAAGWATRPGPRAGDPPIVEREIRFGELVPRLRARLVDESGEPMTGARIALYQSLVTRPTPAQPEPDTKPETKWVKNFDVGADGWVDLEFYVNEYTQRFDRRWAFVLAADARSSSLPRVDEEGAVQVSFAVPHELAPGAVHEMGELTMRLLQHPLIVSGRCVTREGSRGAAVIHVTTSEANWQDRTRLWQGQPERDGSFTVRATLPEAGEVIVSAGGFGHLGVEEVVPVGTTGLELIMVKGITLRGRVILPDATPWLDMEIRMPGGRAKELFPGGNFSVDYLRPAADSWVSLECNGREVWRSAPILIEGEGDSDFRPAQVQNVDLRQQLRSWSTQIVAENGELVGKEFRMQCLTPDGENNWLKVSPDGFVNQLLPSSLNRMQLVVRGDEPIDLSWPPPAQVVLRKSDR